jgi:hypothetical protein
MLLADDAALRRAKRLRADGFLLDCRIQSEPSNVRRK